MDKKENLSLNHLTSLRGILALWVVFYHYKFQVTGFKVNFLYFEPIINKGYYAVDGFFILSGFILSFAYLEWFKKIKLKQYFKYLLLRLARIYPLHIFTLFFMYFLIYILKFNLKGNFLLIDFFLNLLLLQTYRLDEEFTWNLPSWSLSVEWVMYVIFPFLAMLLSKFKITKPIYIIIIITLWNLIYYYVIKEYTGKLPFFVLIGFLRVFFQFITGIFFFLLYRANPYKSKIYDFSSLFLIFNILLLLCYTKTGLIMNLNIFLIGLLIFTLSKSAGFMLKISNHKILQKLGLISFSIYMLHYPIGELMENLLISNHIKNNVLIFPVYISLVIIFSCLVYEYLEVPVRDFIKRRIEN